MCGSAGGMSCNSVASRLFVLCVCRVLLTTENTEARIRGARKWLEKETDGQSNRNYAPLQCDRFEQFSPTSFSVPSNGH